MKWTTYECAECDKVFLEPYRGSTCDAYWIGDDHFCGALCAMKAAHVALIFNDAYPELEIINGNN